MWRDLFQVFLEMNKGIDFPKADLKSQFSSIYVYINLSINIIHTQSFHYKHATTISGQNTTQTVL
jgi:hypothetical protein